MKKRTKSVLTIVGILATLGVLTSCNSFCSSYDSASYRYQHDPINTRFFSTKENANEFVYSEITAKNKKDTITFDKDGTKQLTKENVGDLTVNVFVDGGKIETRSLVSKASELFTFDTTDEALNPETKEIFTKINSGLENTYFVRSSNITVYKQKVDKKDETKKKTSEINKTFSKNGFVKKVESQFEKAKQNKPVSQFWNDFDKKVIEEVVIKAQADGYFERFKTGSLKDNLPESVFELLYGFSNEAYNDYKAKESNEKLKALVDGNKVYTFADKTTDSFIGRKNSILTLYGYTKYVTDKTENKVEQSDGKYWTKIETWNEEVRQEHMGIATNYAMSNDFIKYYKNAMNQTAAGLRTCITIDDGFYGHYGKDPINASIKLSDKSSWKDAWEHGFLEGLLVYPIAYMVEYFSHAFGMNGWGQIGAVLLVTIIVRAIFMLITFKSTLSQQRMTALQPEIAKLQQKYPNSNTNQYEKQRLAQAQMALYKKHKIHPFSSLLIVIIQFPIFISVWNGFSGSASLTSDAVLGLRLSDTIWSALTNFSNWPSAAGWWTALVLILLMSAGQIISMQLPRWLQKKQLANIARTGKNPAETSSQKQMKWVSWIMTIFIIIMGFTLPAAMGVYWFAGALFAMIQTAIMHVITTRKSRNSANYTKTKTPKNKKKNKVKATSDDDKAIDAEIVENVEETPKKGNKKGK